MFAKILQWIRERIDKMLNTQTLKTTMKVDVAISPVMITALQTWCLMYENKATWLVTDVKSLNLASTIAGEIARAVTIEMKIKLAGGVRAEFLAETMRPVQEKLRRQVEYGVAKGGLMMKPYIDGNKIAVDFIQADQFYPINFDTSGKITACVFSDQRVIKDWTYTRLEYHEFSAGKYTVKNEAFKVKGNMKDVLGTKCNLSEVPAWKSLQPEAMITGISRPLFGYFKYPQANNIDPTSPLGVSCYSRAVELIKQADQQWSDLLWEFDSGKRALYVDNLAFGKDSNGKPILPIKRLYRTLEPNDTEKNMFEAWSPDFREVSLLSGLDAILRKVEFSCGLAYGTLSNPQTIDKTATELKIAQQRSYATITDTQKSLEIALNDLLYAIDIWTTLGNLAPKAPYIVTYDFDDSIVVDKDAQFTQDLRLVTTNIMSKVEFRMRNFGEDQETAQTKIDDAAPAPIDMGQGGF